MKILITGATGFVGSKLAKELILKGHDVVVVSRDAARAQKQLGLPAEYFDWDPMTERLPATALEGVDAIANLAGESVAGGRWTAKRKRQIYESRILGGNNLAAALELNKHQVRAIVSASAIGFYGDRGDEKLVETSIAGQGFLVDVCKDWEQSILNVSGSVRKTILRIGIVLGRESGMLAKVLPLFQAGVAGPIGNGKQSMSWIHVDDLVKMFIWALETESVNGVLNAVAPQVVSNSEFTRVLAKVVGMPALFPAPAIGLKLAFGGMSTLMLASQAVLPKRTQELGYQFLFSDLDVALRSLLKDSNNKNVDVFTVEQWMPKPIDDVFKFFSDAKNLEVITPPWLHFHIAKQSTKELGSGTMLDYNLRIHGVPAHWTSRIEEWEANKKFVDTQVKGPYAYWHHTHSFVSVKGGTLMTDKVLYRVPMGFAGKVAAGWKISSDLKEIFSYRRKVIAEKFGI